MPAAAQTIGIERENNGCQYFSIQEAINNAIAGDTLLIDPVGGYEENLVIDFSLTLAAAVPDPVLPCSTRGGLDLVRLTAALPSARAIVVEGPATVQLDFLEMTAPGSNGGTLLLVADATVLVRSSVLVQTAVGFPGADPIFAERSTLSFVDTVIQNDHPALFATVDVTDTRLDLADTDVILTGSDGILATDSDVVARGSTSIRDGLRGIDLVGDSTLLLRDSASVSSNSGAGIRARDGTEVTLDDDAAVTDNHGSGIDAANPGTFVLLAGDARVHDNTGAQGAGLRLSDGAVATLFGQPRFDNNTADTDGGAIHARDAEVFLRGDIQIHDNTALAGDGGAVFLSDATLRVVPPLDLGRVHLFANRAPGGDGGAIYLEDSTLEVQPGGETLIGATIDANGAPVAAEANVAGGSGGGIFARDATIKTTQVVLTAQEMWRIRGDFQPINCRVDQDRGCVTEGGVRVVGNQADLLGGGIRLRDADLDATGAVISHNAVTAPGSQARGGGIAARGQAVLTLTDTTISHNSARSGGGIYLDNGATATLSSDYADGLCRQAAGAAMAPFNAETNRYCAEIAFNVATTAAGALLRGGSLTLRQASLFGNAAVGHGGAAVARNGSTLVLAGALVAHNRSANATTGVRIRSGSTLISQQSTYADALRVVYQGGTGGSFDGSIVWNSAFAAMRVGMLSAPSGVVPGACNIGLGVRQLVGPATGSNLEGVDPLFLQIPETDFFLAPGSPAIDRCASGPPVDLLGTGRPVGFDFDMGAFEP